MNEKNEVEPALFRRVRRAAGLPVSVSTNTSRPIPEPPLVAVTSSRLGTDPSVHRTACRFLTRSLLDCRMRGGSILIADGSAIDPWATRGSELFGVPVVRVFTNARRAKWGATHDALQLLVCADDGTKICRDRLVVAMADRVDAVHVRRGGKIVSALQDRLADRRDASTRVAISSARNEAAIQLVGGGAIGWYCPTRSSDPSPPGDREFSRIKTGTDDSFDWAFTSGRWLIHQTRASQGAWPTETDRQYRDAMLLGDDPAACRGPLDALSRIVRSRRLVGASIATDRRYDVVCFSAASLRERLLARCYRPHLKRWDCEPYGVAIDLSAARDLGAQPVVYGDRSDRDQLAPEDRFRFQAIGKTYDWTSECEWRILGDVDLDACDHNDVRVFVPSMKEAHAIRHWCPWKISCVAPLLPADAIIR